MIIPTVKTLRKELGRSQKEMAELLGISAKAVQSYEQGWRNTPPHVEQQLLFQAILHRQPDLRKVPWCWSLNECSPQIRKRCPSAKLKLPGLCWFITGTLCQGKPAGSWAARRERCLECKVMKSLLKSGPGVSQGGDLRVMPVA
jgi:transcriptional regulator with XRE-family HTH domain